eukprot:CAMPEP_0182534090 /NCGR_PEP_ID=MMETSP1323-20130603/15056_1 /TAXON_ID=236787 /ORGANISM="Florenciella parvula, Strain RCC1693" /LENGTH=97 /DNA_ID=CAMNT_0024744063 /DNA_START=115 /DNA_END=405 /DNA_ORIENTATION=-
MVLLRHMLDEAGAHVDLLVVLLLLQPAHETLVRKDGCALLGGATELGERVDDQTRDHVEEHDPDPHEEREAVHDARDVRVHPVVGRDHSVLDVAPAR